MVIPELKTKVFPLEYPDDVVSILKSMSFSESGLKLLGSMSLRSQIYAGDFDAFETVEMKGKVDQVVKDLRVKLQQNIKELQRLKSVFIADIKSGCVDKWRVIPRAAMIVKGKIVGWDYKYSMNKLKELKSANVISDAEFKKSSATITASPTINDFFAARDANKYHILRWKPKDVLANSLKLRDGSKVTLEQTFQQPAISKMDVIALVQNSRFTDFSAIYEFRCNGKTLNPDPIDIQTSLAADILYYSGKGKYFKAIKRTFALAKFQNDLPLIEKLTPVLNSDLGILYRVAGDIGTLLNLLEYPNVEMLEVRYQIDQMIWALSNIYTMTGFLKDEPKIVEEIKRILGLPKDTMKAALEKLEENLDGFLQNGAKKVWDELKL